MAIIIDLIDLPSDWIESDKGAKRRAKHRKRYWQKKRDQAILDKLLAYIEANPDLRLGVTGQPDEKKAD